MHEVETIQNKISDTSGEIVMYQPDETIRLEVRLGEDTVWLNRNQISILFGRNVKTIGKHINNALREELCDMSTVAKFETVQKEGNREVTRLVEFYNIDMIISAVPLSYTQQKICISSFL